MYAYTNRHRSKDPFQISKALLLFLPCSINMYTHIQTGKQPTTVILLISLAVFTSFIFYLRRLSMQLQDVTLFFFPQMKQRKHKNWSETLHFLIHKAVEL